VGSPAKVIRSAPDFPTPLTEERRKELVGEMVAEFDRYMKYEGVRIDVEGDFRSYTIDRRGSWRLLWRRRYGAPLAAVRGDTVLSEVLLTEGERATLRNGGIYWLDLAGRTRSVTGSPLTEELASFLGRYGIRLPRDG
jgi:hypothetical protein